MIFEMILREFSNICSVSVGKPAIKSAPKVMSGRPVFKLSHRAIASSRLWRRFIRFKIILSPACSDRCKYGVILGSVVKASNKAGSISAGSMEDRRKRDKSGTSFKTRRTRSPKGGAPGRSPPQLDKSTPVRTTSL